MHRFHPSRGRILFEVFCALTVSASFVGAWIQTYAPAFLPAAAVALLYGLVHLFDMRGPKSTRVPEPQRIDFATDEPTAYETDVPLAANNPVEQPAQPASEDRPAKAPRKTKSRRASASKEAKVVEIVPPEEEEVAEAAHYDEAHFPLSPLFEPVPIVRQQRTFGRKAG